MRVRSIVVVLVALTAGTAATPLAQAPAGVASIAVGIVPGAGLPSTKTHSYTMSGAVRPLLFWISREDIGLGRIVWRGQPDGTRAYELLVGTDPDRAPRGLNRWGFIAEQSGPAGGSLLALMTGSHDTSDEAESAATTTRSGAGDLRAIRARTDGGRATWQLARVRSDDLLTVRQLPDAIARLEQEGGHVASRERRIAAGSRPGLLVAVADLLDETLISSRAHGRPPTRTVPYAFGSRSYELRLREAAPTQSSAAGRPAPALRTEFETRALDSGDTSRFELVVGTSGELAGVPLVIEWQPRWWLRVRLALVDDTGAGRARP